MFPGCSMVPSCGNMFVAGSSLDKHSVGFGHQLGLQIRRCNIHGVLNVSDV